MSEDSVPEILGEVELQGQVITRGETMEESVRESRVSSVVSSSTPVKLLKVGSHEALANGSENCGNSREACFKRCFC